VLLVDLYGTGDSAGDFADASFRGWSADLQTAAGWLGERGVGELDVLAVRGGALLLQDLKLPAGMRNGRAVLWQPLIDGRLLVAQFLRLRVAEEMTRGERDGESVDVRKLLRNDGRVEVGGYEITRELVAELEAIADPLSRPGDWRTWHWFEVTAPGVAEPGTAAQRGIAALRSRGAVVSAQAVAGDPFWATPEVAVAPALIEATVTALAETAA
jgi:exosortase A-associated hydrolase 2